MTTESLIQQIALMNPQMASAMQQNAWFLPLMILELIIKIIFYPIALYTAGKQKQKTWFVILFICFFVLNDFGILPILYLIFNKRMKIEASKRIKSSTKKKR